MFGHNHSHSGSNMHGHSHSHGQGLNQMGFDESEPQGAGTGTGTGTGPKLNKAQMAQMQANMMAMMKNAAQSDPNNPMLQLMQQLQQMQMTPQMAEFMRKMQEQRQILMKQFIEQGGPSNPTAMQEMMSKTAQFQASALAQLKAMQQAASSGGLSDIGIDSSSPMAMNDATNGGGGKSDAAAASLLSANLNASKLDDLINKKNTMARKSKEEEETRILDMIARKDYTQLNLVKATQYGVLERVKELIENEKHDVNQPDAENVYLLHWAAINNRLEIAKYFLSIGAAIDPIGGELMTSPLNWAARSGHVHMVVLLLQNGANPCLYDVEGFSTIHVATMFAHSNVVAYLLAKGLDVCVKS
jgi:hypothetical protein